MSNNKRHVLILGSGGREHALAWRCCYEGYRTTVAPGNAGIALETAVESVDINDTLQIIGLANRIRPDLIIVGPEQPLVAGLADELRKQGFLVLGPSADAARLEGSKAEAKEFMKRFGIDTAKYQIATSLEHGLEMLASFSAPPVVKASGLASGKGVVVPETFKAAEDALRSCFFHGKFGDSGNTVVLEERLVGQEISYLCLCDGERYIAFPPTQDHKRLLDGDQGPNTGGMGAYGPAPVCDADLCRRIENEIVEATLSGLRAEGRPFVGVLFVGLMVQPDGRISVIEYNVRFGDPEVQPLMFGLVSPVVEHFFSCAEGKLQPQVLQYLPSATVILASPGYPETSTCGIPIHGLERWRESPSIHIFHAGTRRNDRDLWESNGGRVLGVCAKGESLRDAVTSAYDAVSLIEMDGMHFRRDIAARAFDSSIEA